MDQKPKCRKCNVWLAKKNGLCGQCIDDEQQDENVAMKYMCFQCKVRVVKNSHTRCSDCTKTGRLVCIKCNTRNALKKGRLCEPCYALDSGVERAKCNNCKKNLVRSFGLCKSCGREREMKQKEEVVEVTDPMMCTKCTKNRKRSRCGGLCQSCYNADMREQSGQARRPVIIPVRSRKN